jgi:hypothetical protein
MSMFLRARSAVVVLVMIAAACGGGASTTSPAPNNATNPADSVDGSLVSSDGLLSVVPPSGVDAISVDEAGAIEELDGLGQSVRAYDLGPDGSTFDEPVQLRFEVTADEIAGGVLVVARSTDGAIEPLVATIDLSSEPAVVVAEIDHFTVVELRTGVYRDITVKAPAQIVVGGTVPVDLQIGLTSDQVASNYPSPDSFSVKEGASGEWSASGNVTGTGPGSFVCSSVGTGSVSYSGLIIVDYSLVIEEGYRSIIEASADPGRGFLHPSEWTAQGPVRNATANVECVEAATEVPIDDQTCVNFTTGEYADGCVLTEDVTVSGGSLATFTVSVDGSIGDGPEDSVKVFFIATNSDGEMVAFECGLGQGCIGWFGAGFAGLEVDLPVQYSEGDRVWSFSDLPIRTEGSDLILDVPPGALADGSATTPGGPAVLIEATIFVENGDFLSTTRLSIDGLYDGLSP